MKKAYSACLFLMRYLILIWLSRGLVWQVLMVTNKIHPLAAMRIFMAIYRRARGKTFPVSFQSSWPLEKDRAFLLLQRIY